MNTYISDGDMGYTMSFSLVLHGHIPACRKSGRWPAGEEWLHEAIIEVYLPMLRVLDDLKALSIPVNINIEFTPILLEQLADPYMQDQFIVYLDDLMDRARSDTERFKDRPTMRLVARHYLEEYIYFRDYYVDKLKRDVIGAYRRHQDDGTIELFTSAATHGFLPLMEHDSGVWSQVKIGIDTYKKYFGRDPRGFWLPECAFRPMVHENGKTRAGLDYWLDKAGVKYFIVNYTGIDGATVVRQNPLGVGYASTYEAYKLAGTGVCVFGRNFATSERVWSSKVGYPGNVVYREFHIKDHVSGLRYFAVSSPGNMKFNYSVERAREQARLDAMDFARLVEENLRDYKNINGRDGIIVAPYDFELFGHWWYEGPEWLREVFTLLADVPSVETVKLGDHVETRHETFSEITLEKTSWGEGGDFRVWEDKQHAWIWPYINSSQRDLELLLARIKEPENTFQERVLKQMARELLLMEGSDWPFLLHTKQASDYANQRFHWHHQRFSMLLWAAKNFNEPGRLSESTLEEMEDVDHYFEDLDLDYFREI